MEDLKETIDNGQTEVQIATIGDVVGTGADGSPVEQHLTEDSLKALAEKHKDDEILVDADHQSETGGKTEAKGWLSSMKFVPGKGLFGTIKWTSIGKKLIENRIFRWLSPSWYLDKDTKEPVEMTSVALTNKPSQAGRIEPIVNSAPVEMDGKEDFEQEKKEDILTMEKEELMKLIDEAVAAAVEKMKASKEEATDEVKEEVKEEVVEAVEEGKTPEETKEEVIEEVKEETADNACSEDKADNGCGKEEDEVKNEEVKEEEEEKKEEVIKIEALNSAPKTFGLDIIKNSAAAPHYKGEGYAIVTKVS